MEMSPKAIISVDSVLMDPLIKALPTPPSRSFVAQELRDKRLNQLNIDALAEMDFEEIVHKIYVDSARVETEDACMDDTLSDSPVSVALDTLAVKAVITLHQVPGREGPTEREIRQGLADRGIVAGIREEFVLRLAEHPIYNQRFRIAEGVMPVNGTDGSAVFHFDVKKSLSLEPSAEMPDFMDLDFTEYVHKGTLLCDLLPPTPGTPGRSVLGEELPGANGVPSPIKAGNNAVMSEDGTQIFAACDGQVYFKNNRVGVSRVMVLDDVDQTTGNILFVGSVLVRGSVEDGRLIQAGGNITVCGSVKNAKLAAGRNLVLINGITGAGNALISAEGSIRARFVESARVKTGGDLYCDSALNSQIECGGNVVLAGERGRIVGGVCQAAQSVTAREIGNRASIRTSIVIKQMKESGMRLDYQMRVSRLQSAQGTLDNVAKSISFMENPRIEHVAALIRAIYIIRQLEHNVQTLQHELDGRENNYLANARIMVKECLYSDVHLEIHGTALDTKMDLGPCMITYGQTKLVVSGMGSYVEQAHPKTKEKE